MDSRNGNLKNHKRIVSIIIPCRNEKMFIKGLLENILQQDYNKKYLEVILVDGMSDDGTQEIIKEYESKYSFIKLLLNEEKVVPHGLNKGINASKGDVIIRMDAHALFPDDYISQLLFWQVKLNADNVGGVWLTKPYLNTLKAQGIALVLSHCFGVGDAYFRIGVDKPKEVDTVPFGCYKRNVFAEIGLFDEDLVRNQDDELNARLKRNGGKVYIIPNIKIIYYARSSLKKLWEMYFQYGYFKPLVNIKIGIPSNLRQFIPFLFILSLIVSLIIFCFSYRMFWIITSILGVYCVADIFISLIIAIRNNIKLFSTITLAFATIHFSYGIGYMIGIFDFFFLKKHKKKALGNIKLSR